MGAAAHAREASVNSHDERFHEEWLGWQPAWLRARDALPAELSLCVPEGQQGGRLTAALMPAHADGTPMLLVWDLGRDATSLPPDRHEDAIIDRLFTLNANRSSHQTPA